MRLDELALDLQVAWKDGKGIVPTLNGTAWDDLPGVEREVPARKLLQVRMIWHWPSSAKLVWTDYIFLCELEPIAVRVIHDRSTGKTRVEAHTNNQFKVDEVHDCVVGFTEKPFEVEQQGELGLSGQWPIAIAITAKSGSVKLVVEFSEIEQNFPLSVNGMPFRLIPKATKNPELQSVDHNVQVA